MSNAILPVTVGLIIGSLLIATMIVVANSLHRYNGRVNALTFANGNVEYFDRQDEVVLGGPDNVNSGTDQVLPSITFDDGVILALR